MEGYKQFTALSFENVVFGNLLLDRQGPSPP